MNDELLDAFAKVESKHWWWAGRRELVGQFVRKLKSKNLRILDVGCGTGETMTFLKRIKPKAIVWGIDISQVAVAYAKSRGHKNVKSADAKKLPFADSYFDAVLLLDVLEHVKDQVRVLGEIKRVLKPGGKLLITAPALKFVWSRHDIGQGHKTRFDKRELRSLAKAAGLGIDLIRYFNFVLSGPIIAIRWLSRIPVLGFLANYDNGVNYRIANVAPVNNVLKTVFIKEIDLIDKVNYPWGISLVTVMTKHRGKDKMRL